MVAHVSGQEPLGPLIVLQSALSGRKRCEGKQRKCGERKTTMATCHVQIFSVERAPEHESAFTEAQVRSLGKCTSITVDQATDPQNSMLARSSMFLGA